MGVHDGPEYALSSTSMDYLDLEEAYLFGRAELEQKTNIGGRVTE